MYYKLGIVIIYTFYEIFLVELSVIFINNFHRLYNVLKHVSLYSKVWIVQTEMVETRRTSDYRISGSSEIILKTIANRILGLSNRWNRNAYGLGIVGIAEHLKLTIIATCSYYRDLCGARTRVHRLRSISTYLAT